MLDKILIRLGLRKPDILMRNLLVHTPVHRETFTLSQFRYRYDNLYYVKAALEYNGNWYPLKVSRGKIQFPPHPDFPPDTDIWLRASAVTMRDTGRAA